MNKTQLAGNFCVASNGLARLSPQIGHFVVVTARGEVSTLGYLQEHGRIQNLSLASNSGHVWRPNIADPKTSSSIIAIPDHTEAKINGVTPNYSDAMAHAVKDRIHYLVSHIHGEFPTITPDERELCGAVVYQFSGSAESEQHKYFQAFAKEAMAHIDPEIAKHITFEAKHVENKSPVDGLPQTQGYIDFKPHGMDKGLTTTQLFEMLKKEISNPFVIVAGDSKPDYAMMQAAAKFVGDRKRLLCIGVGTGLQEHDKDGLIEITLKPNGHQPVDMLHLLFERIGDSELSRSQILGHNKVTHNSQVPLATLIHKTA